MRCLFFIGIMLAATTSSAQSNVPFIGCPSEGMGGHVPAPLRQAVPVQMGQRTSAKLAYYAAEEGIGVLAPRGWNCINIYGSDGAFLVVSPHTLDAVSVVNAIQTNGLAGNAVVLNATIGFTSGRDEVAPVILRVFPSHKRFANDAAAAFEHPRPKFLGPFKTDQLRYLSAEAVEFTTPPSTHGIGTMQSHLAPNDTSISGVHILVRDGDDCCDLISVAVRLPPTEANLAQLITHQVELSVKRSGLHHPHKP